MALASRLWSTGSLGISGVTSPRATMLTVAHVKAPIAVRAAPGARLVAKRGASTRTNAFGSWKKKQPEPKKEGEEEEAGIDFTGLKQLVSMGLGTLSGDITEINLDDPTRTVVMELEANNFEDKDGNPLQLNAMDNTGYVGEEGEKTPTANYVVPVALGAVTIAGVVATMNAL